MAAALQLKRSGFEPLLLESQSLGGLLRNAHCVENYLGFPRGCSGETLVRLFAGQLKGAGVGWSHEEATRVERSDPHFLVHTARRKLLARTLVFAPGTKPKRLSLPGEKALSGKRVFYEIRDLPKKKTGGSAIILGGGDAAFDYALSLARTWEQVKIAFRGTSPTCLPLLEKWVENTPGIRLLAQTLPLSVREEVEEVILRVDRKGRTEHLTGDYLLIAVGRTPRLDILAPSLRSRVRKGATPPGLYLAGDVCRKEYRQAGLAAGDGLRTAMEAERYLRRGGNP
jgi:thioredoxin reductase (NADPH)